jgi:hypothetical protein
VPGLPLPQPISIYVQRERAHSAPELGALTDVGVAEYCLLRSLVDYVSTTSPPEPDGLGEWG